MSEKCTAATETAAVHFEKVSCNQSSLSEIIYKCVLAVQDSKILDDGICLAELSRVELQQRTLQDEQSRLQTETAELKKASPIILCKLRGFHVIMGLFATRWLSIEVICAGALWKIWHINQS